MQTHRQIARRKTVLWQAAAAAILCIAGTAAALPFVRDFLAPPPHPEPPLEIKIDEPPKQLYEHLDVQRAGDAFERAIEFNKKLPPPPPPEELAHTTLEPAPVAPPAGDWAYLGSIITPSQRHALVRVDGQQQIYPVGAQHHSDTLIAIEPSYIELESAGVTRRVDLALRTQLVPADPPKRPVVFRQPPNFGTAGANPGMMAMSQSINGARPGTIPATMEQARANAMAQQQAAMAAAEASRRAQAAVDPPGLIPLDKIEQGERDMAMKSLSDPNLGDDERMKFLGQLGIGPGTPTEAAIVRMKEAGVDLSGDNFKRNISIIESNAKNKP